MPRLQKTAKARWGVKYYAAVKNAVFITQAQPNVPISPPPCLKEYVSECGTLYMCTQCKDCFHFRSSLEDHISRKSWILGYWCQRCFLTTCKHSSGSLCSMCVQLDHEKRLYLQRRGLRKNQKYGVVRIFYNQCQFFAHLKTHDIDLVYMGDIMLMPLPTNINDWNPEVDLICEALMEHTFIIKVHIMDWLRDKNISDNWWKLATSETEDSNNPIAFILKRYKGRFYFKPLEIPMDEQFSTLSFPHDKSSATNSDVEILDSVENVDKKMSSSSMDSIASISDESVIENEDSPCTANEIAFVDCGFTSKYLESEIPLNSSKKKNTTISVKSIQDSLTALQPSNMITNKFKKNKTRLNCISPDMVMSYGNIIITPKRDVKDLPKCPTDKLSLKNVIHRSNRSATPIKTVTEGNIARVDSDKRIHKTPLNDALMIEPLSKVQSGTTSATKTDICRNKLDKLKQNVHTLTVNSGQKVVTIQSAKHVDIDTIIGQLPPHITNNKKIVFIKQASENVAASNSKESPVKTVVRSVPDENEKALETKKNPDKDKFSQANKDSNKNVPRNQTQSTKGKSRSLPSKVVYQNGKKYIIKQSLGSIKNSRGVSNTVIPMKDVQRKAPLKSVNDVPPLIPLSSTEIESISNKEGINPFHGDVIPLTPSPSPSELSSSSSCDVQSKQPCSSTKTSQKLDISYLISDADVQNMNGSFESLSFHKGEDQNLYLDVKFLNQRPIYTIVDTSAMVTKCREEMLNEFFHLSHFELQKRFDHLQQISEEISRVMNFVTQNVIKENFKAVLILQTVLKHCIDKCGEKTEDVDEVDAPLNEWESEYQKYADEKSVCKSCEKITKPKSYIPGFSKPAKHDTYCSCYRHVCHKCNTYQGNSTRFVAHQTFHDKEKPFLCPDCYRKFLTYKSLEVHTWTTCFHTLKKRVLGCKICEVDGFQDMESVARHFAIMHSHGKIACDKCYLILPSYSKYAKHHKEKHPNAGELQPIRLVLCKLGRCIVRCEDYMLHMEKHSVVQRLIWFKCPFCVFIHVEPKRIMSHLQSGHETRLKELLGSEMLLNILHVETATSLLKNDPQLSKFTNAHAKSCEDGTVVPKIVNARTITSELFERGTDESDDYLISYDENPQCSENVDVKLSPSLRVSETVPKILDVKSVANVESSRSKCGTNGAAETPMKADGEEVVVKQGRRIKPTERQGKVSLERSTIKVRDEFKEVVDGACNNKASKIDSSSSSIESRDSFFNDEKARDASNMSTSEVFPEMELEHTIKTEQEIDASSDVRIQEQFEGEQCGSITDPPPLTRIPWQTTDSNRSMKFGQVAKGGKACSQKTRLPQRIALNSSNDSDEVLGFSCHLCGELINTSAAVMSHHFQSRHSQDVKLSMITANVVRLSPGFINGGYKELIGNKKRKSDNGMSNSKRRRRWTPKKYSDGKNANFTGVGLCVTQETAKDSEGNFRCKKCDQRCSDMVDLREHIASNHRIRGRYLVCLECGDNFVVAPSLQMHLKAFHGIEDPITYMSRNTSYAPDNVDDLEAGGKSIEANQCHVCMAVFEDKAAVDKHLRVHGMAFLNRKRIEARNALKSPEKRSEEEEEKHTLVKGSSKEVDKKDKPAETILDKITATI